jgi:hypothetical protein
MNDRRAKIEKVYIRYCRPYKDNNDEPPIDEIWNGGKRPGKELACDGLIFVYDLVNMDLINERSWDGIE